MLIIRQVVMSIFKSLGNNDDVKTWMMFSGDNEQFAILKNMEWSKRLDKRIMEF
jgi:hypothetical protein